VLKNDERILEMTENQVLAKWKTSVVWSVVGVIMELAYQKVTLPEPLDTVMTIVVTIFLFVYALWLFPSLFSETPKLANHQLISFLNCFVGGLIFGLIWNHSLTKKKKGISNIVCVIVFVLSVILLSIL
jgi:hypothetical protein